MTHPLDQAIKITLNTDPYLTPRDAANHTYLLSYLAFQMNPIEYGMGQYCRLRAEHQEHPNKRTIHTAEELQQLPEGTVIIGHNGWVWENMSGLWHTTGSLPPMDHGAHIFTFPARVIYMPEEGDQQ